jgi:predicted HTH domain antitoxin
MSKRSAHRVENRSKGSVQDQRRLDAHILQLRTEKIALAIASRLKPMIQEEVKNELDRRGYTGKTATNPDKVVDAKG